MKKFVQNISASLSKGMVFGLGILLAGAVLAAGGLFGLNDIPNDKDDGDTVTAQEFNMIISSLKGLQTGCTGGMVLKGLKNDGTADCVAGGGGGGGGGGGAVALPAPEGVSATVTATAGTSIVTVGLSWGTVVGATGYELMRTSFAPASGGNVTTDGVLKTSVSTSYSFGNLTKATHYFKVRATAGSDKGLWSSVLAVTATTVPSALPNGSVILYSVADGSARVTWNPPTDTGGMPIVAYEIKFTPTGNVFGLNESESWLSFIIPEVYASIPPGTPAIGQPVTIVSVSGETREYISTGIPAGTYTIQVRAINAVGAGAWTNGGSPVIIATPNLSANYTTAAFTGALGVGGGLRVDANNNGMSDVLEPAFPPWIGDDDPSIPIFPGDLTGDSNENYISDLLEQVLPNWMQEVDPCEAIGVCSPDGFGNMEGY